LDSTRIKEAKLPKRRDYPKDWFFETAKYPVFNFYLNSSQTMLAEFRDEREK
jgi:hypothetical protein